MDTKRKIILALGLTVEDREQVFDPDENPEQGEASGSET
jgi:hypothetical protein